VNGFASPTLDAMLLRRPGPAAVAAAAVLCAVCALLPASAGASDGKAKAATASVPAGFVGMNINAPVYPGSANLATQLDTMVADGVQSVRIVFDWSYAQPYKSWSSVPADETSQFTNVGGIPTRFGQYDDLLALAAARHITVFPTVAYAPGWDATNAPTGLLPIPKKDAPFAAFCAALARRYGSHGTFWKTTSPAEPIRMWEIWNEPNLSYYWSKQPFENTYVPLLHAAYDAIKGVDRSSKVMVGGLTNTSWNALKLMYKVPGAGRWFDGVALHPYTEDPSGVITIMQYVRAVLKAHGGSKKTLVADEISWPSSQGVGSNPSHLDIGTTEAGQAKDVTAALALLGKNRRALNLVGFDYYTWGSIDDKGGNIFDFAGLYQFNHNGSVKAKPAAAAYRTAALKLEGCRKKGSVATDCVR
jgi:hypothetical protein